MSFFFACICMNASAQKHDTLQSVKVRAKAELNTAVQSTPVQSLNKEELQMLNSSTVAEAVKHFAGIIVKDYGGIGGLKTVSVRSLGANHTGVLYDGLVIGDAQGGQIDLGKFSLDNADEIRLYSGGNVDPLSPARAFSTSSLLMIKTSSVDFSQQDKLNMTAGIKQGSFGLIQPSVSVSGMIGKKIRTGISGTYQSANGNYPFSFYDHPDSIGRRKNSDIKAFRIEYDAAYQKSDSNVIRLKVYRYESKRGLPPVVIPGNATLGAERLTDRNSFIQGSWRNKISARSNMLISMKLSLDYYFYLDPRSLNVYHRLENRFHQQEAYFSGAYTYKAGKYFTAGLAADYFNSKLRRSDIFDPTFAAPNRNSFIQNLSLQFKKESLEINSNLLYTAVDEKVLHNNPGRKINELTPAFSFTGKPFRSSPLRIRGFYRNILRTPTFNDLYFTQVGNINLKPERANLFDLGLTYGTENKSIFRKLTFTADAYYNKVKNKIVAVPNRNLFQWSMQNFGRVDIHGIDAAMQIRFRDLKKLKFNADATYSYQYAADLSDPTSSLYKNQLPYTPQHSGSLSVGASFQRASFAWNALFSSYRYRQGIQNKENFLQGFNTNDISLSYRFKETAGTAVRMIAEFNNIFNIQYDIIKYYPMPGFNYRIGLIATFKK